MIIHEVFAQIFEEEIKNIIVCDNYPMAGHLTKCVYGETAVAVDCLHHCVAIGDKYHDGAFWRVLEDGAETLIPTMPTQEHEVQMLKEENEVLTLAMAEMIGGGI